MKIQETVERNKLLDMEIPCTLTLRELLALRIYLSSDQMNMSLLSYEGYGFIDNNTGRYITDEELSRKNIRDILISLYNDVADITYDTLGVNYTSSQDFISVPVAHL